MLSQTVSTFTYIKNVGVLTTKQSNLKKCLLSKRTGFSFTSASPNTASCTVLCYSHARGLLASVFTSFKCWSLSGMQVQGLRTKVTNTANRNIFKRSFIKFCKSHNEDKPTFVINY